MARIKTWFHDDETIINYVKEKFQSAIEENKRCLIYAFCEHYNPKGETAHTYKLYMIYDNALVCIASGLRYTGGGYDKIFSAVLDTVCHFLYDDVTENGNYKMIRDHQSFFDVRQIR